MISAYFRIKGEDYEVDWDEPSMHLFEMICWVCDREAGDDKKEYEISFTKEDFSSIKNWLSGELWLFDGHLNEGEVIVRMNGLRLILNGNYING